jgi:hypothetical protein
MLSRDQLLVAREDILLFLEANEPAPMQVRILTLQHKNLFLKSYCGNALHSPAHPFMDMRQLYFEKASSDLPRFILDPFKEA